MAGSENGSGGWPYRFELIPLDDLFVDPTYQRPLSSFAERIKRNYNPAMVGTLVVSERNDRRRKASYAVVDGQTRKYGMAANDEPVAPCLVYTDLSPADEAKLFADLQTQRRGMATSLRFRAALLSGDGEAQTIAAIARAVGMKMAGDEDMSGIKSIAERLSRVSPSQLRHRANALREGSGSSGSWDRYVREAMIGVYARGRRSRGNS
jgi:hypothetical protein